MKPNEHEDPPIEGGYTGFPKKRTCNLHEDCDESDKFMKEQGYSGNTHCNIEDCNDCFGD